eukprot:gene5106-biopygen8610
MLPCKHCHADAAHRCLHNVRAKAERHAPVSDQGRRVRHALHCGGASTASTAMQPAQQPRLAHLTRAVLKREK